MVVVAKPLTRRLIIAWTACVVAFLYIPIVCVFLVSFHKARYFSFPFSDFTLDWYGKAFSSLQTQELMLVSLKVAGVVTAISVVLALFGALAFARFNWRGRKLFQRLLLLPIFFPQAVLGLALLIWLTFLGVLPSWQSAVFAHLVWIAPIVTLVVSIQVYGYDAAQEEAAFDLGATRLQVLREVTLPALAPGLVSGALFAFLLSWGNFPLSFFTTGADSTVPEWLYTRMVAGYTPLVPTMGALIVIGATIMLVLGYALIVLRRRRANSHG
ncbi:MAG: ABC transporter permease [Alphaproteobacteria bacterium]|nr:ABC transporter permease [Alphaproteobacteria bacterium]